MKIMYSERQSKQKENDKFISDKLGNENFFQKFLTWIWWNCKWSYNKFF